MKIKIKQAKGTVIGLYKVEFANDYTLETFDTSYYMALSGKALKAAIIADIERAIDDEMDELFRMGVPGE